MSVPPKIKIYHITHVDNLPSIIREGCLVSDAVMIERGGPIAAIGMSKIKTRRLTIPLDCHDGDFIGDYVPFYFCSRSVMLYVIHCANHEELIYRGGQPPIIHLEADLSEVIKWAKSVSARWAFTLSNAGAYYVKSRADLSRLDEIDWDSVAARDWRASEVRERKQAEFLVHESFPWHLVERIGTSTVSTKAKVDEALRASTHRPRVEIKSDWYY
ncbi:MAG: type II toxin-antitoxin system toxin DNA ADP-ribosyl transferase DarT [Alphaproteobacteria bacterium]